MYSFILHFNQDSPCVRDMITPDQLQKTNQGSPCVWDMITSDQLQKTSVCKF
jgi:hypothetical protein